MLVYYGNIQCISARELIDKGYITKSCYDNWVNRGRIKVVLAPLADILKGREGRQGLIDEFLVVILEPGLGLGCVNRILRRHQFLIPLCL